MSADRWSIRANSTVCIQGGNSTTDKITERISVTSFESNGWAIGNRREYTWHGRWGPFASTITVRRDSCEMERRHVACTSNISRRPLRPTGKRDVPAEPQPTPVYGKDLPKKVDTVDRARELRRWTLHCWTRFASASIEESDTSLRNRPVLIERENLTRASHYSFARTLQTCNTIRTYSSSTRKCEKKAILIKKLRSSVSHKPSYIFPRSVSLNLEHFCFCFRSFSIAITCFWSAVSPIVINWCPK